MPFIESERAVLLNVPGLGPRVIQRLEEIGVDSIGKLRDLGADEAVRMICCRMGTIAWANRRGSLRRACKPAMDTP